MEQNEKTELTHWEDAWSARPRMSFPTGIDIGTRNVFQLLKKHLHPGVRYVEVGCAPGKILSWVARELDAPVCGIDYSPTGVEHTKWLCEGLDVEADVRCEDALSTSFEKASFDLVFSCGLIEHFDDPAPMVAAHVELLAPGGTALIAIPNYSGLYLKLQRWCDPDNLAIHNLDIMNENAMYELAPKSPDLTIRSFSFGKFSPWLISLPSRFGRAGVLISWGLNFIARLQPFDIKAVCPLVVLEIKRL
ncbi:MAG TPA: class I SAM-dependent methyltransferase [Aeromonadales bacterium]|nr:class I SAM-dependent methyltransferase [Aeromonadales bacterium]